MLVPVASLAWRWRPTRYQLALLLALLPPAALQLLAFASTSSTRPDLPLGATPLRFVELIGGQVLLAGTLGARTYRSLFALGSAATACATVLAAAIGAIVIARALATASAQLQLLVLFATLVLAATLWSPVVAPRRCWEALRIPDTATRYYVLPIVAYLARACSGSPVASDAAPARSGAPCSSRWWSSPACRSTGASPAAGPRLPGPGRALSRGAARNARHDSDSAGRLGDAALEALSARAARLYGGRRLR